MLRLYKNSGLGKKITLNPIQPRLFLNVVNYYCNKNNNNNNNNNNINNNQRSFSTNLPINDVKIKNNNDVKTKNNNDDGDAKINIDDFQKLFGENKENDEFFSKLKWSDGVFDEDNDLIGIDLEDTGSLIRAPKNYYNIRDQPTTRVNIEHLKTRKRNKEFEIYNSLKPKMTKKEIEKIFNTNVEQQQQLQKSIHKNNNDNNNDNNNNGNINNNNNNNNNNNTNDKNIYILESIQTCIDRFSFLIKPGDLKPFDIVMVYNGDEFHSISFGYIEAIDYNDNTLKIVPSTNNDNNNNLSKKDYLITDIYCCLPLSVYRENFGDIYNEFLSSLFNMKLVSNQDIENLYNLLNAQQDPIIVSEIILNFVCQVILKAQEQFSNRELEFFNKYGKSTKSATDSVPNKVINGLSVIGNIDEWNGKMKIQNDIELNEAARKFYENVRYKSPWSDIIFYFSFISTISQNGHYKLKSFDYFQFTKEDELLETLNTTTILQNESKFRYILIFQKYCLEYMLKNIDGFNMDSPLLNETSRSILNDTSIPSLSSHRNWLKLGQDSLSSYQKTDPLIPSEFFTQYLTLFIDLLHYNNHSLSPSNSLNESISKYLLGEIIINGKQFTEPLCAKLFKTFKPFKTSSEFKLHHDDSIQLKDIPEIKNAKLHDDLQRFLIKNLSFSFFDNNYNNNCDFNFYGEERIRISSPEPSFGILNRDDGSNYIVFINIPDVTDSFKKYSSLDSISMLRSQSIDLPNKSYKMLPIDLLKDLKLYEDKKIGFNQDKYRSEDSLNYDTATANPYYSKVGFDNSYNRKNGNRCISLVITFNGENNEIISYDIVPSYVHKIKINTFSKFQKMIDHKFVEKDRSYYDLLKLYKIAKILKKRRTYAIKKADQSQIEQKQTLIDNNNNNNNTTNQNNFDFKFLFNKSKTVNEKDVIRLDRIDPHSQTRVIYNEFKYLTNHLVAKYSIIRNINTIPLIIPKEAKENYANFIINNENQLGSQENNNNNKNNNNNNNTNNNNIFDRPFITYPINESGYNIYTNVFSPLSNYLDLYVLRELKEKLASQFDKIPKKPSIEDLSYANYAKNAIFPYLEKNLNHLDQFKKENYKEWSNLYRLQEEIKQKQEKEKEK
ncbi:hypothetical protein ACTFIY_002348 [Dictyostelium cf. discoideum]